MEPLKLNRNERTVLYGLVRHPDASDLELSELIDVKRPTITKIRNKLFDLGLVSTYYAPNFQTLGMEMLVFWQTKFVSGSLSPEKESDAKLFPYNILMLRTGLDGMGLATFPNFTAYRRYTDENVLELIGTGSIKGIKDHKISFHPFDTNRIDSYFDYAPAVDSLLGLGCEDWLDLAEYPKRLQTELSSREKSILATMVANPQLSDSKLSALMGMSRPTISEKRNAFTRQQLVSRRNLPGVGLLGAELVGFYNIVLDPRASDNQRNKAAAEVLSAFRPFIQIHGRLECTGMFIARSFEEYKRWHDEHLVRLAEERRVSDDISIMLMPVNNIKVMVMNFAPAVRYALGLPQEA